MILATQEEEIIRIASVARCGQIVHENLSQKQSQKSFYRVAETLGLSVWQTRSPRFNPKFLQKSLGDIVQVS
jgi:hypothetical protein